MNRYVASIWVFAVVLLASVGLCACGKQPVQAQADDLTAGNRAELVTVGGARLDSQHEQQVTVRVGAGELRIIAKVTGEAPGLECTLNHLEGEGDAAHWVAVPLKAHHTAASHDMLFTLRSSSLEPGAYRLTYTGHGRLEFLGMGANYR